MSLDRVPGTGGLYIGGLITLRRSAALKAANITHVVSALRGPLDPQLFATYKRHLVLELDDVDDEDIMRYFPECNAFIDDGLKSGGGVLVHCAMGKSRSATLVIAYLLSKDPQTSDPTSVLNLLRGVREIVEPNWGFARQLELYHSMGCPANIDAHPTYQRWLFQQEVESSIACGRAPETIRFEDEAASSGDRENHATDNDNNIVTARCRKCRRVLATDAYIHKSHAHKSTSATQIARLAAEGPISSTSLVPALTQKQCAHVFLDPLSWMRSELEEGKLEGRLECPGNPRTVAGAGTSKKCGASVGKYAWQGMRCSCGEWVVPGFSLAKNKIDLVQSQRQGTHGGDRGPNPRPDGAVVTGKI